MKRSEVIKANFTRNWNFPGKERLANWFRASKATKESLRDGIIWLNDEDIAIYTTADNYIEWTIFSTGTYEDEINKLIRISLRSGDNAIDVGGNIGLQSIRMAQCVGPAGKVYAFEPLNYLQNKFQKNILLNRLSNITLFPLALSDADGEAEFQIDENTWNQGTFSLNHSGGPELQTVIIKIGDHLINIKELANLALIKIDVEGFEYNVLRGLSATLAKHKPRLIFEYDHNYWNKAGQNIHECYNFLVGFGYKIYQVNSVGCEQIHKPENILGGNIFCVAS